MTSSTAISPRPGVLVLGARGRFGGAAVTAFAEAGWHVVAQVRAGAAVPIGSASVQWVACDPADTLQLATAAAGCSVVVHALSPAYTHAAWRRDVLPFTEAAISVSRMLGATLMVPANVYVFGESMPRRLHEDTPQAAQTLKGRIRIAMEQRIEQATRDGLRAVLIRAGDFFGSGRGSWLDTVIARDLAKGRITWPGPLDVPTAWAYLPDLARSFVAVAEARDRLQPFERLHFAGYSVTGAQWVDALGDVARAHGWPAPRVRHLPWPLLRLAGLVVPMAASLAEMRYLWRTPHALVDHRMARLVGPLPQTPFDEAVRRALAPFAIPAPKHLPIQPQRRET